MIKLAIVFLPIVFAIIWMLFIGLNINKLNKKINFFNFFMPPVFAICSLILISSSFIYFYSPFENIEKKELINPE